MRALPISVFLLVSMLGCVAPRVVTNTQDKNFRLADLKSGQVALLPVAVGDLDESSSKTVAEEYQGKEKFLDAFSAKLSQRLISACKSPSLGSERMQSLLMASEATRPLLDPTKLLGAQDPNNRFAEAANANAITALSQLPELKGIKYVLVARDLSVGRQWSNHSTAGGGFVSTGPGGGAFMGGSSSSAKTNARLRLAILDLDAKTIVWDGAVFANESSTFMKATALHEIEDDLVANFVNEVLGIQ